MILCIKPIDRFIQNAYSFDCILWIDQICAHQAHYLDSITFPLRSSYKYEIFASIEFEKKFECKIKANCPHVGHGPARVLLRDPSPILRKFQGKP